MNTNKERITLVISAYPASGKTYLYKNYKGTNLQGDDLIILDSDSTKFSWIYEDGVRTSQKNPNFIQDYIQHIKENIGKVDIIFVSSHKEVRQALRDNNIKYFIVHPVLDMKDIIIDRMIQRGNDEKFIEFQKEHFEEFIEEIISELNGDNGFPIVLTKDRPYLSLDDIVSMLNIDIPSALAVKWWN